ncbi:MAG: hypothetical protein WAO09_04450 [Candidatus Dormiibacterota bacterium]|jgi:hypothetical protein
MARGPEVSLLERYGPALGLLAVGTLAVVVVLVRGGVDASQVGRAYVLGVGALLLFSLVQELRRSPEFVPARRKSAAADSASVPPELEHLRDALRVSRASRRQYELQVVPRLQEIAADQLMMHGISLKREPDRVVAMLGPELGALLLPDQPDVVTTSRRGPQAKELEALLDALEGLGR